MIEEINLTVVISKDATTGTRRETRIMHFQGRDSLEGALQYLTALLPDEREEREDD